jgi:S-adenosylmethionine decarboxylase
MLLKRTAYPCWPEYGYAALDIFMCGDTKPHLAVDVIREAFQPREVIVHEHLRGRAVAIAA